MTNEHILTKAIEKAVANGWKKPDWWPSLFNSSAYQETKLAIALIMSDHDLAKALWGERGVNVTTDMPQESTPDRDFSTFFMYANNGRPRWQYHLQAMVIADDPIAYLGEHL